jgi:hydroxypyruvate reductase
MTDGVTAIREALVAAYATAIEAVGGRNAVGRYLSEHPVDGLTHAVAVGKAAAEMATGALDVAGDRLRQVLVVTKHGHLDALDVADPRVTGMQSAHPVPDQSCLDAGEAVWRFFVEAPDDAGFLLMVSGGASSLLERLPEGLDAGFLAEVNDWLLAGGYPIGAMNRVRKRLSTLKGGRLANALAGREALCLMISDVPDDDPKVIGSGPLIPHVEADMAVDDLPLPDWLAAHTASPPALAPNSAFRQVTSAVVANPAMAREAAARALRDAGLEVTVHPALLEGDALEVGREVVAVAANQPGRVQLWASETTVVLPSRPGRGGRCQSLALSAALAVGHGGGVVLAAGTDGTDGPGEDAGAVVDAGTLERGGGLNAAQCLCEADAGRFLAASGDLIRTGPTGTNVMDLVMAWSP